MIYPHSREQQKAIKKANVRRLKRMLEAGWVEVVPGKWQQPGSKFLWSFQLAEDIFDLRKSLRSWRCMPTITAHTTRKLRKLKTQLKRILKGKK